MRVRVCLPHFAPHFKINLFNFTITLINGNDAHPNVDIPGAEKEESRVVSSNFQQALMDIFPLDLY